MSFKKYISLLYVFLFTLCAVSVSHAKHADDPTDTEDIPPVLEEISEQTPQDAPGANNPQNFDVTQNEILQEMLSRRNTLLEFTPELLHASLEEKLSDDKLKNLSYNEWSQYAEAILDKIDERNTSPDTEETNDSESDPENPPLSSAPENTDGSDGDEDNTDTDGEISV